ncbi:MAG: hypothetical protein KAR19_20005 [Bacteroidales bacterium]|nr:hypothetical protein [Bacteroidales bacterium]
MKIVAFVDTLGFKQKISTLKHEDAKRVIKSFNSEIYQLWGRLNYNQDYTIHGQTFSDSLIVYTDNESNESLRKVLNFLTELYKIAITKVDLPLRGGISIGDFDRIPATNFDNLQKELVIGSAFIDAYFLESTNKIKGSKIIFRHNIHLTVEKKLKGFSSKKLLRLDNGEYLYELIWGDIEFLSKSNYEALEKFIDLAVRSKWLDHYYHTLETFLTNEQQTDKHQIFRKILAVLKDKYKYNMTDDFIEIFFRSEGITNLKKSFLAYLRDNIRI